ncbi:MAG: hypothetical protein DMG64_04060 [Acidobacteria bacterium]|nr:MAG: hypothetical protein DMG64_04060 [Acidobacteriota bacterium]PYY23112.1 MAG: hypothetical protein DMG62_09730 [Acidobacteriota bacterium]
MRRHSTLSITATNCDLGNWGLSDKSKCQSELRIPVSKERVIIRKEAVISEIVKVRRRKIGESQRISQTGQARGAANSTARKCAHLQRESPSKRGRKCSLSKPEPRSTSGALARGKRKVHQATLRSPPLPLGRPLPVTRRNTQVKMTAPRIATSMV